MDSDRRHELQHNTLDNELGRIVDFIKGNINRILTGVIIILLVLIGWTYIAKNIEKGRSTAQLQYDKLRSEAAKAGANTDDLIAGFVELSNQTSVDWIAADSLIRLGRLHAKNAIAATDQGIRQQQYAQAEECYNQAMQKYSENIEVVAYAMLGLGKLAEDKGDFTKAADYFKKIINDKALVGYPVVDQAQQAYNTVEKFSSSRSRLAEIAPQWMQDNTPKVDESEIPQ